MLYTETASTACGYTVISINLKFVMVEIRC